MRISLLVFLLSLFPTLTAQYIDPYPINSGNGEKMFEFENYQEAVRQYTTLLKEQPKNLGNLINTAKDELSPHLVDDGKSLYFSSNRAEGLGGLDLYVSHQAKISQWSKPQNLGYPINTVNDDLSICFAENKRYAYVAQKRADSYGDLDIYRLTFKEEREEYTLMRGLVMATDSSLIKEDVLIEVFSKDEYELKGSFLMNKQNSSYVAILPPGKYQLEILNTYGFKDFGKTINLSNKNDFKKEIKLDFFLEPKP